jgi:flagellin-like protein
MKGISAIIATILLLLITIALAGTAYVFTSGMLSGKTEKSITILSGECSGNGTAGTANITLVVSNDGTEPIQDSELTVVVDNNVVSNNFDFGTAAPHSTVVATGTSGYTSGVHNVIVTSPSNHGEIQVYCA